MASFALLLVGVACSSSTESTDRDRGNEADGDEDDSNTSSGGKSSSGGGTSDGGSSGGGSSGSDGCAAKEERCPRGCAALETDVNNCGSCGNACPTFAGVQVACVAGECAASCDGATEDLCQDSEQQLYCIDIANDPQHCGGCGNGACSDVEHGAPGCVQGQCRPRCDAGYDSCQTTTCIDLQGDRDNCGTCGRSCRDTMPEGASLNGCSAGRCAGLLTSDVTGTCDDGICPALTCTEICQQAFGQAYIHTTQTTVTFGRTFGDDTHDCSSSDRGVKLNQVVHCSNQYPNPLTYACTCESSHTW